MAVYPTECGKCKNANPCISRVPGFSNGLPCSDFIKRTPFHNITPDDCILCVHWIGKDYHTAVKDAIAKGYQRLPEPEPIIREPSIYAYDDEFLSSNEFMSRMVHDYLRMVLIPFTSSPQLIKDQEESAPVSRYDYVNVYNDYMKVVPITSEPIYVKREPKPKPKEWNRFAELDYGGD